MSNMDNDSPNGDSQSTSWLFNLKTTLETAVKAYDNDNSSSRKRREPEPERDSEVDTMRRQQYSTSGLTQRRHQPQRATAQAPSRIGFRTKQARPKPEASLPQQRQNSRDAGDGTAAGHLGHGEFRPLGWATAFAPPGSTSRAPSEERNHNTS